MLVVEMTFSRRCDVLFRRVEGWFEEDKGAEGEIITSEFLLPVTHYLRLYMLFEGVPR